MVSHGRKLSNSLFCCCWQQSSGLRNTDYSISWHSMSIVFTFQCVFAFLSPIRSKIQAYAFFELCNAPSSHSTAYTPLITVYIIRIHFYSIYMYMYCILYVLCIVQTACSTCSWSFFHSSLSLRFFIQFAVCSSLIAPWSLTFSCCISLRYLLSY